MGARADELAGNREASTEEHLGSTRATTEAK